MRADLLIIALSMMATLTCAQEKTDRQYPTKDFDYAHVQEQIDALSKDSKSDIYQLAKAQAWLNSSKYEMWRNDAGWWPREAFEEASRIVTAIKNKDQTGLSKASQLKITQLIADDLWQEASMAKKIPKSCAKQLVARAEVELVHAAYEAQETTWKDPTPQLALAKSLLSRAKDCQ
jgi:hypothetical protein